MRVRPYPIVQDVRLILTPNDFQNARWSCGRWSKAFCVITVLWSVLVVAVLISPYEFPVNAQNFNFAPVILIAVTLFGVVACWLTPEEAWLSGRTLKKVRDVVTSGSRPDNREMTAVGVAEPDSFK